MLLKVILLYVSLMENWPISVNFFQVHRKWNKNLISWYLSLCNLLKHHEDRIFIQFLVVVKNLLNSNAMVFFAIAIGWFSCTAFFNNLKMYQLFHLDMCLLLHYSKTLAHQIKTFFLHQPKAQGNENSHQCQLPPIYKQLRHGSKLKVSTPIKIF